MAEFIYPALRCTCGPGISCDPCIQYCVQAGRSEPKPRTRAPYVPHPHQGPPLAQYQAVLRARTRAWLHEHGRLPQSADLAARPAPPGLSYTVVVRAYGTIPALWHDCYQHGLCTGHEYRSALARREQSLVQHRQQGGRTRRAQHA